MKGKWAAPITSLFSSVLAIICPLCIPALGAFLASIGLGIALNIAFLQSLLIALLFISVISLGWSVKLHGKWWVLAVGLVGAIMIYAGRYLSYSLLLMGAGAILLIGISFVNLWLKFTCKRCEQ